MCKWDRVDTKIRIKPKAGILCATQPYATRDEVAEEQRIETQREEARKALSIRVREWPLCPNTNVPVGFAMFPRRDTQEIAIFWRCACRG